MVCTTRTPCQQFKYVYYCFVIPRRYKISQCRDKSEHFFILVLIQSRIESNCYSFFIQFFYSCKFNIGTPHKHCFSNVGKYVYYWPFVNIWHEINTQYILRIVMYICIVYIHTTPVDLIAIN